MPTAALLAAALMQAAPAPSPDVSWMAGYWLDCSGGREASETWSDPRQGLSVGHAVTVSDGEVSFEVSRIGATPAGFAYVAQPGGAPPDRSSSSPSASSPTARATGSASRWSRRPTAASTWPDGWPAFSLRPATPPPRSRS